MFTQKALAAAYVHSLIIFSAASRGSATAQLYRNSINYIVKYHRTPSGEAFEIIAKSIPKRRRINEKTSLERRRRRNVIFGKRPHAPEPTGQIQGLYLVAKSQNKRETIHQQIILKTSTPKHEH